MEDVKIREPLTGIYEVPLYKGYLGVVIVDEELPLRKFCSSDPEGMIVYGSTNVVSCDVDGVDLQTYMVAFNFGNKYDKITNGIIAHEVFHAASLLLQDRGLRLSNKSDEAYAYLIGWMTDKIYEMLKDSEYVIG